MGSHLGIPFKKSAPQKMKNIIIHYFSGTGNSWKLAKSLGKRLQNEYKIRYINIEADPACVAIPEDHMHLFVFPIYAGGIPHIFKRYLNSLLPAAGTKAAIICSCHKFSGAGLKIAESILHKKGFQTVLSDSCIYPNNLTQFCNPDKQYKYSSKYKTAEEKLDNIVATLKSGMEYKNRGFLPLTLFAYITSAIYDLYARKIMGKIFTADRRCNGCNLCMKACPTGVIMMENGRPYWNWECEGCQRCINACPQKSIQSSILKMLVLITIAIIALPLLFTCKWFFSIPLYLVCTILLTLAACCCFDKLEKTKIAYILAYGMTKKYRRYLVKGYSVKLLENKIHWSGKWK